MKKLRLLICLPLFIATCAIAEETAKSPARSDVTGAKPPAPVTKGQRIYAAHHSYFVQVPPILAQLSTTGGFTDQAWLGNKYIGGSKSLQHWNLKDEDNKAKEILKAGAADVLILTPVYLPDEGIEKFAEFGLASNPDIRVTVQEFWLPYDAYEPHYYDPPKIPKPDKVDHNAQTGTGLKEMHARYFQEMDALIGDINRKLGKQVVFVVPVGQAVIALREKIISGQAPGLKSQDDLFTDPLGHPKPALQVMIAYTHFAVIYRKNPAGLPIPSALAALKLPDNEASALNHLLQELAWDAATHHPLSGVMVK